jgi:hypothetical protein
MESGILEMALILTALSPVVQVMRVRTEKAQRRMT